MFGISKSLNLLSIIIASLELKYFSRPTLALFAFILGRTQVCDEGILGHGEGDEGILIRTKGDEGVLGQLLPVQPSHDV